LEDSLKLIGAINLGLIWAAVYDMIAPVLANHLLNESSY
jgi:uncharacterized membrane protein YuzA (DUF378 family)